MATQTQKLDQIISLLASQEERILALEEPEAEESGVVVIAPGKTKGAAKNNTAKTTASRKSPGTKPKNEDGDPYVFPASQCERQGWKSPASLKVGEVLSYQRAGKNKGRSRFVVIAGGTKAEVHCHKVI